MAHDAFALDGSVAVVTGGSRGLGEATAVALAEAGADVAPVARSEDELAETAARVEATGAAAHPVTLDVTDSAGIVALFDEVADALGPADVLVNNAGTNPFFGDARDLDAVTSTPRPGSRSSRSTSAGPSSVPGRSAAGCWTGTARAHWSTWLASAGSAGSQNRSLTSPRNTPWWG